MATSAAMRAGPEVRARILAERFTHAEITKGLRSGIVREIVDADILSRSEIAQVVPARTLARRLSSDEPLKTEEADAIGRLVRLSARADTVFGDAAFAHEWLRTGNPALGGVIPLDLARTDAGAREVEAILDRIAYGDYG